MANTTTVTAGAPLTGRKVLLILIAFFGVGLRASTG